MMVRYKSIIICCLGLFVFVQCDNDDTSSVFMEAAQELFENKNVMDSVQGLGRAFMQSDTNKPGDGINQILSGLGNLMSSDGGQNDVRPGGGGGGGIDYMSMLGGVIEGLAAASGPPKKHNHNRGDEDDDSSPGINFESMLNMASMFLGQQGNADGLMGILPVILDTFSGPSKTDKHGHTDHSDHSWYMPPVIENLHVMWDHFRNSELGQTLWKNSGLANIVGTMTDENGMIDYGKIMESFENPRLRRRWLSSLTNFVAEWLSHVSDPATRQRYMATVQFIGNSFLKSQGYPKSVMFEPSRPSESLSKLVDAVARRHLNMKLDSYTYIKPAFLYGEELLNLASEKGFIMSRINARELSNKLNEMINNDLISPLLRAYRAYKWGVKEPHCSAHILCSINQKPESSLPEPKFRAGLTKIASFPAAWAISNKSGISFWSLYGAILENDQCSVKYPVDCSSFHEEEVRVTTEAAHSEL